MTGFDNTPVASSVGFSSVEQPLDEVAAGVLDLLTNPPDPAEPSRTPDLRHRLFRPRLVTRDHPVGAAPADR